MISSRKTSCADFRDLSSKIYIIVYKNELKSYDDLKKVIQTSVLPFLFMGIQPLMSIASLFLCHHIQTSGRKADSVTWRLFSA